MKIKWLGHASFLITARDGTKIITDPYCLGSGLSYSPITDIADVVTVGHDHIDHSNVADLKGKPQVVNRAGTILVKGIEITGFPAFHDTTGGKERGNIVIYRITVDGVRVCHVTDLGHKLTDKQAKEIGEVDVLLTPVGGFYTVDAAGATALCNQLKPRLVIPMHFKTSKCQYPISGVEDFLKGKTGVRNVGASEIEISRESLPKDMQIAVLSHAN